MLYPFTPELSQKIWIQLGYEGEICTADNTIGEQSFFSMVPVHQKVNNSGPVFLRIGES